MREGHGPRPSLQAAARLADDVRDEVADLRVSLRTALDEAERLEADGRHDLAAALLQDQRAALAHLHERLSVRLADAAVEREAEHVVDTAPTAVPAQQGDQAAPRMLAAVTAVLVGVVLLVSPDLGGAALRIAGSTDSAPPAAPSGAARGGSAGPPEATAAPTVPTSPAAPHEPGRSDRADPAEPTQPTGEDPGPVPPADLAQVAGLIARLADVGEQSPSLGPDQQPPSGAPVTGDEDHDERPPFDTASLLGTTAPDGDDTEASTTEPTVERRDPAR